MMFGFAKHSETEPLMNPVKNKLNLPWNISTELGRLATLELKSSADEQLNHIYQQFLGKISHYVTLGLLKGQIVFKPYFKNGQVYFSAVEPSNFKILLWDEASKIPLITEFYERKDGYLRVERHELKSDSYVVTNIAMRDGRIEPELPPFWKGYTPEVVLYGIKKPLFSLFSTIDGKPVFQRALPLIEEAENQFSRLVWEFKSGERALYVSDTAFLKDLKGRAKVPDKRLYRLLSTSEDNLFKDWTPEFREQSLISGLDCILKRIEDCCSLARGTFSDVSSSARTATELKISRQKTYASVKELQGILKCALEDMLDAAASLLCLYGKRKSATADTKFYFDDSVLSGKGDEIADLLALIEHGVLEPKEVRQYLYPENSKI